MTSLSWTSFAQESSIEEDEGDKHLEVFAFEKAINQYSIAFEADSTNFRVSRKLADAYRRKGDLTGSAPWYKRTLELDSTRNEDLLYYAEALKTQGLYDESLVWYEKYNKLQPKDDRAENHLVSSDKYLALEEDKEQYLVKKLDFNNRKPAFGVTKYGEKLVFSATGLEGQKNNKNNPWNDLPYLDVYESNIDENNQAVDVQPINEINSKYNDGPAHFDDESQTMFVTRNNMKRGKPVKDKTGSVNLKIYTSTLVEDSWSEMSELSFNSDDYSTGHPTVSADGQRLYFASNRPGGEGGTDIYVCEKINDTWGRPENLGNSVNTKGDELFPYIDDNDVLYFSSTGHLGLGGMDLFKIRIENLKDGLPENLGYPLNSAKDDFSILFEVTDESGYFCSNRDKGFSDDIFYFELSNMLQKVYAGRVESSLPEKSLAGGEVIVRDLATGEEINLILDENGEFEFDAIPGTTYELAYVKGDVEEILAIKTVEDTVSLAYENLGIFTIQERLAINIDNDREEIDINGDIYKRFNEDGRFISEQGDTLTNIDMMDLLSNNIEGNSLELNNSIYKANTEGTGYFKEDGEEITSEELEELLISEIFANPLNIQDNSALAGLDSKYSTLDLGLINSSELNLNEISALEWVNDALKDDNLTPEQRLELESLKSSELTEISAKDWLDNISANPELAETLTSVERRALGIEKVENVDIAMDSSADKLNLNGMSALDWINDALKNESLSPKQRNELDALKSSDLSDIPADEWLNSVANNPEEAENLTSVEKLALGILEENTKVTNPAYTLPGKLNIENINDYVLTSKDELKSILNSKGLEDIYFDFDRTDIISEERENLDELAAFMMANPNLDMYVSAHTDARGNNSYNDALSERRASSVQSYLGARGVDISRLKLGWYGEDQLANNCTNDTECEENAHRLNRRASFALAGDLNGSSSTVIESSENNSPESSLANASTLHGLENIYYDFDKSNIREDAQETLEKVYSLMATNSETIVINAHTDKRGNNAYNDFLSENRAISAKKYLIDKGISAGRIEISWAGETQLAEKCPDSAGCTEKLHQLNRRASISWK